MTSYEFLVRTGSHKKRSKTIFMYIFETDRQRGEGRERKGKEKEEVEEEGPEEEVTHLC